MGTKFNRQIQHLHIVIPSHQFVGGQFGLDVDLMLSPIKAVPMVARYNLEPFSHCRALNTLLGVWKETIVVMNCKKL